ncbi:MAG: universal stress protein [Gemmatimonadota bacterium]
MALAHQKGRVRVRHILAAADESEGGRAALLAAGGLGRAAGVRVSVLTVIAPPADEPSRTQALERLRAMVRDTLLQVPDAPRVETAVATGLPGIEIGRFAELVRADLIVIGRSRGPASEALSIGDPADSLARRSPTPCLIVTPQARTFARVLVALDGSERGMGVLLPAINFARAAGARLRVVSVEPIHEDEVRAPRLLTARSARLLELVNSRRAGLDLGSGGWDEPLREGAAGPVVIRNGAIVDELIREVGAYEADVLVVGYHRGGPAAIEGGSVARRLVHEAPCTVLTVPL